MDKTDIIHLLVSVIVFILGTGVTLGIMAHKSLMKRLDAIEEALKEGGMSDATMKEKTNQLERTTIELKGGFASMGRKVENMVQRLVRLEMKKTA